MSDHYYSKQPSVQHDRQTISLEANGRSLTFITDAGVFARQGVDYGSRVLIEVMDIPKHAKVLDVGCGYGPIGLSAAVLASEGHVTLLDINERAIQLAKENASNNRIHNVTILQSDLFESVKGQTFTTILTNPPIRAGKEVVHRIFSEAAVHLESGGALWVVIQKKQGAPSAFSKLESLFDSVEEVAKNKGYRIFKAIR